MTEEPCSPAVYCSPALLFKGPGHGLVATWCHSAPQAVLIAAIVILANLGGCGTDPFQSIPRSSVHDNPAGWPPIEFQPPQLDFGNLTPGGEATGMTRIWNVGSVPLKIEQSITSCGCTAAEDLTGRVIPAGGFIEFSTTMSMKSGLGEKKEKISIRFEGYSDTFAVFYFTAEVSLPIRVTPPHIRASQREVHGWVPISSGEVLLEASDGKPFRLLASHGQPPDFIGYDPAHDPPRAEYRVRWDLDRFAGGTVPWFWVFETDRPDCPVVDARFRHSSTLPVRPPGRPWVPKDQRVLVGNVRNGEPFEVTTKMEYVKDRAPAPTTAAVRSDSPFLRAELAEAQRDGQFLGFRIRVIPTNAPAGLLYGTLTLSASGFDVQLQIIGRIVE